MRRDNEPLAHNAGAQLIQGIRRLGFNHRCLLFMGNKRKSLIQSETLMTANLQM
jgi:hypothetical protein